MISAAPPAPRDITSCWQKGGHFTPYPETHLNKMFSHSPKVLVTSTPGMSYPLMLNYCTQLGHMMCTDSVQKQKPGVVIYNVTKSCFT